MKENASTRFIAQLNDGNFINIQATEMKLEGNFLTAYRGCDLVALLDLSTVLCAHLSDKG